MAPERESRHQTPQTWGWKVMRYHVPRLRKGLDPENASHLTNRIDVKEPMENQELKDPVNPEDKAGLSQRTSRSKTDG